MATKKNRTAIAIPLYAVAVSDAIASGDANKMTEIRDQVFTHMATATDVERLLPELEKAIGSKGGVIRPLYAVTIQDALARGDANEIASLKAEAASYNSLLLSTTTDNGPSILPYGVAIQDAKASGNEAEVKRLTALANTLLAKLNAT